LHHQSAAELNHLDSKAYVLLERVRHRLGVQSAQLTLADGSQLRSDGGASSNAPIGTQRFCDLTLAASKALVVPDARRDPRFSDDPAVSGSPRIRFYAGIPLFLGSGERGVLSLFDTRPRSHDEARAIAELAEDAMSTRARRRDPEPEAPPVHKPTPQPPTHSRSIFERACTAAKLGVWECTLQDELLDWSDGVYDIFDLPRGSVLDRQQTLKCYTPSSRQTLETLRSQAIRNGAGFTLDAEITTHKGNRKWIRLTATVESENGVPVRLFGIKQDITEEKLQSDRTRYLAEFDIMTGLANRSQFQARLLGLDGAAAIEALLLVDLDGFKQVNDTHGHGIGDECLKETALRLKEVCRHAELVARIGGDEFAVLLGPDFDRTTAEAMAGEIVNALGDPIGANGHSLKIGASVGIAMGGTPDELFEHADRALYAAKSGGRNTFRLYERAA
jgi:diguanylate cyclase (GGDEF)-like protein